MDRMGFAAYKSDAADDPELAIMLKEAEEESLKTGEGKHEIMLRKIGEHNSQALKDLTNQVKELQVKGGRIAGFQTKDMTAKDFLSKAFNDNADKIKVIAGESSGSDLRLKAAGTMTTAASVTGGGVESMYSQIAVRGRQIGHIRDIPGMRVIPTATGTFVYYRQNTPAGDGSVSVQTTHGNKKSQIDYDMTKVTTNIDYIAGFAKVARQMLTDIPFLQSFLSDELIEDYLRAEDFNFYDQLVNAATGTAGTSTVTVEKIIQTIAKQRNSGNNPTAIVVTPDVWAKVLITKPADYSIPGGVVITPSGDVAIVGIPLISTNVNNIQENRMLIGDFRKAIIVQNEGLNVRFFEEDEDNVQRNLVTARVESRSNIAIMRPEAFTWTTAGTT